ncbi:Pre-mRNA-splicing factor SYF2 [Didymosphaeria variabile]|uniref:Pre-mRNA-splicing factor SYF2 n=1 Tax=Didymosphaeria variabile TaxID=1932322 RepID=A0A9W9CCD3_9PLEO|nr:Pre-mRNA-splicing factor SYF2 [Didymosphaeria variabile]KAJ4354654.1 Pre-mRNA-splicing factor SYF2 [Didymosphaeria variabile]
MTEPTSTEGPTADTSETVSPSATAVATTSTPTETPSTTNPKAALAARMARFKALQSQKESGRKQTEAELRAAEDRPARLAQLSKLEAANQKATYKLLKADDPDFERKRNWDYTVEESESWDKRQAKKSRNRDNVSFADYRGEANKVYKRQVKQMGEKDLEDYAREKGERLQRQVRMGLLRLVEEGGEVFTVDSEGRVNTPVEELYGHDHKPSKEAVDKLVEDLEKGERARLKARAARGINDDSGDVTYINEKNKQFNEKLSRFYNRYTTEIRESFERGTAI